MKNDPVPIKGQDLFKVLCGVPSKFKQKAAFTAEVDALVEKINKEYAEGKMERETYSSHRMSDQAPPEKSIVP